MLFAFLLSCSPKEDLYEQTFNFKKFEWSKTVQPQFIFQITDTVEKYNLYFVMRHLNQYKYNNLRIQMSQYSEIDSVATAIYNFKLGENNKWFGKQMNDVIEYRVKLNRQPLSFRTIPYTYTLKQMMADEVVTGILNAGLRIQKVK